MSGWASDAFSKIGPNILHGPHHSAQKSTNVIPSPITASSKVSSVRLIVAIRNSYFLNSLEKNFDEVVAEDFSVSLQ
jgi:hypothetical protein